MALFDRALTLNPSFAHGWHLSGIVQLWAGQLDTAIEHFDAALRLSPRARIGSSMSLIGAAHFFARRFNMAGSPPAAVICASVNRHSIVTLPQSPVRF